MITDRHLYYIEAINSITDTESCCQKNQFYFYIAETDLWECWQNISNYRYRLPLEFQ